MVVPGPEKREEKHVDFVGHDWSKLQVYLIKRKPADCEYAGTSGDYAHYSEPHTMAECPFNEEKPERPIHGFSRSTNL